MSQNLMFLKCKVCGTKFCIGKYNSLAWYFHRDEKQYNEFLDTHDGCCCDFNGDIINGGQIFELEYDNKI
jgi:hypothetical protein